MRQNERRRAINRNNRSRLRTSIKKLHAVPASGDQNDLERLLPATISRIDRAVQEGVLHRNAAARYKSRLTSRANQMPAR